MKKFSIVLGLAVFLFTIIPVKQALADGPVQPFSLMANTGQISGTVNLTWTDTFNQANQYSLVYGTAPGQYVWGAPNISEGSQTTNFTVGYLVPNQKYYFALVAFQNSTYIATSGPVSAVAASGTAQVVPGSGPAGVSLFNLKAATGNSTGTVSLSWFDSQNIANNYSFVYGTSPGNYIYGVTGLAETPGVNNFSIGALKSGTTYYFKLVAFNGSQWVYTTKEVSAVAK